MESLGKESESLGKMLGRTQGSWAPLEPVFLCFFLLPTNPGRCQGRPSGLTPSFSFLWPFWSPSLILVPQTGLCWKV